MNINNIKEENRRLKLQLKENNKYISSKTRSYDNNMQKMGLKIKLLRNKIKELNTIVQKNETEKLSYYKNGMQQYNELLIKYNILQQDNYKYKNELNKNYSLINSLVISYNKLSIEYSKIYGDSMIPKSEYLRILKINYNLENIIQYLKSEISDLNKNIYTLAKYNNILNGKYIQLQKTSNTTIKHMENLYNNLQNNHNHLENN